MYPSRGLLLPAQDIRTLNQTRVVVEYNAGWQGACAGLVQAPGAWEVCLQARASTPSMHAHAARLPCAECRPG